MIIIHLQERHLTISSLIQAAQTEKQSIQGMKIGSSFQDKSKDRIDWIEFIQIKIVHILKQDLIWRELLDIETLIKRKSKAPWKLNLINLIKLMKNTLIMLKRLRIINQKLKRMPTSTSQSILMKNFKRELIDSIS